MKINKNCSVIILSAGKSERMTSDKAFLLFDQKRNITFVEQIIKVYKRFGCEEIICVFNPENVQIANKFKLDAKIVVNENYESGRFSSIQKACENINPQNYYFIHNIDNPFVNINILKRIFKARKSTSFVSPRYKDTGGHPILLSPEIIAEIQTQISLNLNFRDFLQHFLRINVLIDESKILININNKDQYNQFFKNKIFKPKK